MCHPPTCAEVTVFADRVSIAQGWGQCPEGAEHPLHHPPRRSRKFLWVEMTGSGVCGAVGILFTSGSDLHITWI